jgi:transposase-like protein
MMTLTQLETDFATEEACLAYLVGVRWRKGIRCPRCTNGHVYKIAKPWKWQCKMCNKNGYRFSPLTGTIFENTNVPLVTWFKVISLLTQSKTGLSAHQIHRMIGHQQEGKGDKRGPGSYRTAWYICHRIRAAMKDGEFMTPRGDVEVEEPSVDGKNKNRHGRKKQVAVARSEKCRS